MGPAPAFRWRWLALLPGSSARPASWAAHPMAVVSSVDAEGSCGPTSGPRTATSYSQARSTSRPRAENSYWPWASAPRPRKPLDCARASLLDDIDELRGEYVRNWQVWQQTLSPIERPAAPGRDLYRTSTAVLRTHEDPTGPGAAVASLSIPWGHARTDAKTGLAGYHVIWPRDLVEIAGGLLAAGGSAEATRMLDYLRATQDFDGHWPQNQWVDGTQEWNSIQMGETALPILLLDQCRREGRTGPRRFGSILADGPNRSRLYPPLGPIHAGRSLGRCADTHHLRFRF